MTRTTLKPGDERRCWNG